MLRQQHLDLLMQPHRPPQGLDLRVRTAHRQVGKPSPPFLMLNPSLEMGDGKVTEVTVGGDVVLGGLLANGEHLVESLHVV